MSGTKIAPCTCVNTFQDEQYGKGLRLHNISGKDKTKGYCTVCCCASLTRTPSTCFKTFKTPKKL